MSGSQRLAVGTLIAVVAGSVGFFVASHIQSPLRSIVLPATSKTTVRTGIASAVSQSVEPTDTLPVAKPIPALLPDVMLVDLQGKPKALSSIKADVLLVNFWATWCAPCRHEIPMLSKLRSENVAKGVEIVGIAVDFRADVVKYAAKMAISYPLLIGEEAGLDAAQSFGMDPVFPFTVFSNRLRQVVALKIGELHADEADYIIARVREINAGSLGLEAARAQIGEKLRDLAAARARAKTAAKAS